jgi:Mn2+/Fe2+ NRAMP family transporter
VLVVNQEMVVRLGAVTGVGHARLILERFGRFWGAFSVGDLFLLNFLTIVTEFIGISLAAQYFGIRATVAMPLAAAALIAVTVSGSFRRWERAMYVLVAVNLLVIALAVISHGSGSALAHDALVPHVEGGITSSAVLLIIAIVGTTVAPWQLFFHSLHRGWRDARVFHGTFAALVVAAAGIVVIPHAPLGLITVAVQALAGVLLPSATVFLLPLCNDRAVLGPWTNAPWLNGLASLIVTVLLMLSGTLVATTLFPGLDVTLLLTPCAASAVIVLFRPL